MEQSTIVKLSTTKPNNKGGNMSTFNPEVALTKSRMQVAQEAEIMRRAMHRELSQQAYLICPMNGEVQVSKHEIVEFPELLEMVGQFNRGELPHSDDWFTIEDITEKRYPMEMFYQFIK